MGREQLVLNSGIIPRLEPADRDVTNELVDERARVRSLTLTRRAIWGPLSSPGGNE